LSLLTDFTTIDLETTGLNPRSDEIIEIGATRVHNGEIVDRYHTYVKPTGSVPEDIARLLDITPDSLAKAPKRAKAIDELLAFAGHDPLIAYGGRFEHRFLDNAHPRLVENGVHGLRDLARALLPTLNDHRADTLAAFFEIQPDDMLKSRREATELAGIYLGLIEILRALPLNIKQQMLRLLTGTDSDLLPIFVEIGNAAASEDAPLPGSSTTTEPHQGGAGFFNLGGEQAPDAKPTSLPIELDSVEACFKPGGLLDRNSDGYEHREVQVEMAAAVASAFNGSQILAVEAGTGVGKSLAYLVPAIRYAVQNNARVVVSTNTKNLQEQLFYKDLPALENTLEDAFQYALLKGRANYICLNRWSAATANAEATFTSDERVAALPLVLWASTTRTGDIAEHGGFDLSRAGGLWGKVCSDSGFCRSQKCRTNGRCFANNIRKSAQKAHIVVVNHSLLFSDLSTENGILGEYEHLIIDEAHNVEKVASQYLGRELNIWRVKNLCDQLRSPGFSNAGALPGLKHWMKVGELKATELKGFESGLASAEAAVEDLWLNAQTFFQDLTDRSRERAGKKRNAYVEKLRYKADDAPFQELLETLTPFAEATKETGARLQLISNWMKDLKDDAFPNQEDLKNEIDARTTDCVELLSDIEHLTDPEYEGTVYWMELPSREGSTDTRLQSAPLRIAEHLEELLYERMQTIVYTSATLGIRGRLVYFLRRVGLEGADEDRVKSLCLGSPFDFETQALVCAPQFVPVPKDPAFQEAVDSIIRDVAIHARRGTLGLYTSYSMLNKTYHAVKLELQSHGVTLLGQGIDGARAQITERFREHKPAVLLGTDSFWEGVDLPGEVLEILAIVRLPFAVPTDPLVEAQMEELQKQGKDPFIHFSVPEAILKFRQGFGRLIRNATDRGIVLVLDSRVLSTRYGKAFLESLPAPTRTFASQSEMIDAIGTFFATPGANDDAGTTVGENPVIERKAS
jgi:predicted DnaQ family exonuclease/DinG family helicase